MSEKLKVLQVNKLYAPHIGGVETVVQQLAEGLNDCTDMKVLVCQPQGKSAVEYINGVEVHKAGSLGIFFSMPLSLAFFRQLRTLSKDRDVVHFHLPFPLGDLAYYFSGYKGKVIVWWHSDIVRQKVLMALYKPLMKRFLKRVDRIIVATPGHITGSAYLGEFKNKCAVIPFGLTEEYLAAAAAAMQRQGTVPKQDKPASILFVGRLVYYKGCDVLLEAFARIHGARLIIIGEGELEDNLRQQARNLQIANRIEFRGKVTDQELCAAFAQCDIFVLPSVLKSEAFGLVQMEAMAYGKPVINTALPSGVPYVSIDGQTGLTVPPGDAEALAAAMQKLIDDEPLRNRMGANARKRVEETYRLQNILNQVLEVYR